MNLAFAFSYCALFVVVALEWMALRSIMRETLALMNVLHERAEDATLESGADVILNNSVPKFSAEILGTNSKLTDMDFTGHWTLVLFVNAGKALRDEVQKFEMAYHTLWSQFESSLVVICRGASTDCMLLRDRVSGHSTKFVADVSGSVTAAFGIDAELIGILVDDDGIVKKVGEISNRRSSDESVHQ